ncbi:MAG: sigma-54 dependent transcriptional regulator [Candidatus Desulfofervidaceae bacterium]|nr:sigma-54 dependent transcriptional regulator [Candidatus Desulfofervidaceae bacterium]
MTGKILAVDDEVDMLRLLERIIKSKTDYDIITTPYPEKVAKFIEKEYFDLILVDLRMPDISGMELLKQIKAIEPDTAVVIITAYGTVESAVEAMKIGAFDFITKPFRQEQILLTINRAMEVQALKRENRQLKNELNRQKDADFIIGKSPAMQSVYKYLLQVAPSLAPVVITGETGTGKELVARLIHKYSKRKGPFVAINCSAFPETLIESELFGHVKGAFSGAIRDKRGLVEEADNGTLFLDEVGDLSMLMQTKFLRFLQEGEFRPVGSTKAKRADVRIIAATNKDLEELIKQDKFREDLYYRLNVIKIHVPPLRERKEDIPLLAHYFLKKYAELNNKTIKGFSERAMSELLSRSWPGNVRQLENVIERAVIVSQKDLIDLSDIKPFSTLKSTSPAQEDIFALPFKKARHRALMDFYQRYLTNVLIQCKGNVSRAAEVCGLKRQYFHRLMKMTNIKADIFRRN